MKNTSELRGYTQSLRAEQTADTRQRILKGLVYLWQQDSLDKITLQAVAEHAGTTKQTVIRHFGTKDGLIDAVIHERASGIEEKRTLKGEINVERALSDLIAHYEEDGDAVLRTIAVAHSSQTAARVLTHGMNIHRQWCEKIMGADAMSVAKGTAVVDALVAATDIHVWKLLRRDLGRSREQTHATMLLLVQGILAPPRGAERK